MVSDIAEFERSVVESNETINISLQRAVFILKQANELPVSQRKSMINAVKELISINGHCPEEG